MNITKEDIKKSMAETWDIAAGEIPDDVHLGSIPAWDSVGHVGLMTKLEDNYGLVLTNEIIVNLTSMERIIETLKKL